MIIPFVMLLVMHWMNFHCKENDTDKTGFKGNRK